MLNASGRAEGEAVPGSEKTIGLLVLKKKKKMLNDSNNTRDLLLLEKPQVPVPP